jgi:hypothetical protein
MDTPLFPLLRELYDENIQTTHRLAVSALESEQVLGRCLGDAPLLKSTLSAGDYAEYEVWFRLLAVGLPSRMCHTTRAPHRGRARMHGLSTVAHEDD